MPGNYVKARDALYAAHNEDPTVHNTSGGKQLPYETHYAEQMEHYLAKRDPNASDVLKLAVIGQHFRRWEVPRSSYADGKLGYHKWRTYLKKRQGELVAGILTAHGYSSEDADRCKALIEKEGLKQGEDEVQVLEDVACLVFLDDQFDEFKDKHDEDKIITILQKTWVKMSKTGQDLALQIPMTDDCKALVGRALAG